MKRGSLLVVCGALLVGACSSSNRAGSSATTTSTTAAVAATTTTVPTESMNLRVDDSVRAALTAAWARARRLDPKYVKGTTLGSVYYGFDAKTHAYWALAEFDPTDAALAEDARLKGASGDPLVQFQGLPSAFTRPVDGEWNFVLDTGGIPCAPKPPAPLLKIWNLDTARICD